MMTLPHFRPASCHIALRLGVYCQIGDLPRPANGVAVKIVEEKWDKVRDGMDKPKTSLQLLSLRGLSQALDRAPARTFLQAMGVHGIPPILLYIPISSDLAMCRHGIPIVLYIPRSCYV